MSSLSSASLDTLATFAAVAEAGGFTAAAERLGSHKARVSQEIVRLEACLGCTLFSRTTRRVTLTEAGQNLYARCVPLLRELEQNLSTIGGTEAKVLHGSLRMTASVDQATQSLAPVVAAFAVRHPQLQIELRTSDRVVDLVSEGLDLGFRMGWLRDSSQRARKLADFQQYLVAAPGYLARRGTPASPQDLSAHAWVALTLLPTPLTWAFRDPGGENCNVRMNATLRTDAAATLRALLRHGAGVSVLDEFSAAPLLSSGELVRLLPQWRLPSGGLFAVHPPGRHIPAKVKAFLDFYRTKLAGAVTDDIPQE